MVKAALLLAFVWIGGTAACIAGPSQPAEQLYVDSLGGGAIEVVDPVAGTVLGSFPVEATSGRVGFAISADGERLHVVDGFETSRLRALDSGTGETTLELDFSDRVQSRTSFPPVHLSADGKWLFVKTYDPVAAAAGIRVFDVSAGAFLPVGLWARGCPSPELASTRDGSVVTICPDGIRELRPQGDGQWVPGGRAALPVGQLSDYVLAPDDSRLYALSLVPAEGRWSLAVWDRSSGSVAVTDLRTVLDVPADAPGRGGKAWIGVSADSQRLGIVFGPRAWVLEAPSLRVLRQADLPWTADGVAFDAAGETLLTLRSDVGGSEVRDPMLLRIPVAGGPVVESPVGGSRGFPGPTVFRLAPAPAAGGGD